MDKSNLLVTIMWNRLIHNFTHSLSLLHPLTSLLANVSLSISPKEETEVTTLIDVTLATVISKPTVSVSDRKSAQIKKKKKKVLQWLVQVTLNWQKRARVERAGFVSFLLFTLLSVHFPKCFAANVFQDPLITAYRDILLHQHNTVH